MLSGGLRECYRGVYESAIGGSPRVLSGGLRECYRGVSESAIRGSASMIRYCEVSQLKSARLGNLNDHRRKTHSKANITCKMLIEMVEKDLHPFYARKNLAMIKLSHI